MNPHFFQACCSGSKYEYEKLPAHVNAIVTQRIHGIVWYNSRRHINEGMIIISVPGSLFISCSSDSAYRHSFPSDSLIIVLSLRG